MASRDRIREKVLSDGRRKTFLGVPVVQTKVCRGRTDCSGGAAVHALKGGEVYEPDEI